MLGYDGDRSNVEALKPDASVADESQDEASERIPRGR
jgi:hypothetical protein